MKPLEIYGPLKQAKGAFGVLEMLTDKKKLKEVKDVLAGIEAERQKLNEAIALYGKAKRIDSLYDTAAEREKWASKMVDGAEAEAKEILASAKKGTDEARGKVKLREEAVDAEKRVYATRVMDTNRTLDEREAALAKREEKVAAGERSLLNRNDAMQKREVAYLDRKQALVDLGVKARAIPAL